MTNAPASGAVTGPVAVTAEALMVMLRARFGAPEWALFPQVRNAAGVDAARTADAIAVGLWPSRGCEWHGFEVKVSRGEWVRELRTPAKAESLAEHLDRWWVVASDRAIIRDGELPSTWGLLVPRGRRLVQVVEAPLLGRRGRPLDRSFVAAVMKRAAGVVVTSAAREAELEAAYGRGEALGIETGRALRGMDDMRLRDLERDVAIFEQTSGVRITTYRGKRIGEAVRMVLDGDADGCRSQLHYLGVTARQVAECIERALAHDAGGGAATEGSVAL